MGKFGVYSFAGLLIFVGLVAARGNIIICSRRNTHQDWTNKFWPKICLNSNENVNCYLAGCTVKNGDLCVFPFTLEHEGGGTSGPFNACLDLGAPGEFRCSTNTNGGIHVSGGGYFGVCSEDCPKACVETTAEGKILLKKVGLVFNNNVSAFWPGNCFNTIW
jgi:hypothetical protein